MEYCEDHELTHYVWTYYGRLLTEFEQRVGRAILGRAKATAAQSEMMAAMLNSRWGAVGALEIDAALAEGTEVFRRRVRDRILAEHAAEVFLNRCPKCNRIVRTPTARQCFWCGFDWHGATATSR